MNKILATGLVFLLFLTFFVSLTGSLWSRDALWHLKTGEWIWEHKSLPETDPFRYTFSSDEQHSRRVQFLLKQYWIAQVLFYLSAKPYGIAGLIYLRAAALTLSLWFSFRLIREKGLDPAFSVLMLLPSAYLAMKNFTAERPQLFSFLFATITLYLLENMRKGLNEAEVKKINIRLFFLPLIMLVWANVHGGYVFGVVLISLYIIAEGIKLLWQRKKVNTEKDSFSHCLLRRGYIAFFIICLVSILVTFINPNGWNAFEFTFQFKGISSTASEYRSPISMDLESNTFTWPYYLLLVSGFIAILRKGIRADICSLMVYCFLAGISLVSMRYMAFFVFLGPPVFASYISDIRPGGRVKTVMALSAAGLLLFFGYSMRHAVFKTDMAIHLYPVRAVEYIKKSRPAGRLFNHQGWGGYIIWRLPEYKVFIDTRYLSETTYEKYNIISTASYGWETLANVYGIGVILIPGLHPVSGELSPLFSSLMEKKEWAIAYVDETAIVFLLRSLNNNILKTGEVPKVFGYEHVLKQADYHLRRNPSNMNAMLAAAEAYNRKGMPGMVKKVR